MGSQQSSEIKSSQDLPDLSLFQNLPDDMVQELCDKLDNDTLAKYAISNKRIYSICYKEIEKRQSEYIEKLIRLASEKKSLEISRYEHLMFLSNGFSIINLISENQLKELHITFSHNRKESIIKHLDLLNPKTKEEMPNWSKLSHNPNILLNVFSGESNLSILRDKIIEYRFDDTPDNLRNIITTAVRNGYMKVD